MRFSSTSCSGVRNWTGRSTPRAMSADAGDHRNAQVAFFTGKTPERTDSYTARLQRGIDTPEDRARYVQRFAVVEPVFANLR